ncbi:MAG: hypothetical protein QOC71_1547 [Thermoplasmata archaeon]|jgi:hypothetical protein|nr:hypothetical protein [Thermoplasmata archaeon]
MRWVALVVLLLLAGCAQPTPPSDTGVAVGADDGRTSRTMAGEGGGGRFDATFDLQIRPDGVGGTICVPATCIANADCIFFLDDPESEGYTLSNGTVVLTWAAATPLAEQLVIAVTGAKSFEARGTSPVTLEFDALDPAGDYFGVSFAVDHDLPNVPLNQDVSLRIAFDFEGDLPAAIPGQCSNGIL